MISPYEDLINWALEGNEGILSGHHFGGVDMARTLSCKPLSACYPQFIAS